MMGRRETRTRPVFTRLNSTRLCRRIIWLGRSAAFSILIGAQEACALLLALEVG